MENKRVLFPWLMCFFGLEVVSDLLMLMCFAFVFVVDVDFLA